MKRACSLLLEEKEQYRAKVAALTFALQANDTEIARLAQSREQVCHQYDELNAALQQTRRDLVRVKSEAVGLRVNEQRLKATQDENIQLKDTCLQLAAKLEAVSKELIRIKTVGQARSVYALE